MIEHEFALFTVPHTGAHFTIALLNTAEVYNWQHRHWKHNMEPRSLPEVSKCLLTARDPYLVGLRYLFNGDTLERLAKEWKFQIAWERHIAKAFDRQNFIFDIGCGEQDRLSHSCDMLTFVGADVDAHMPEIEAFVNEWEPLNTTEEIADNAPELAQNKTIYLETGELPQGYDWSVLDDAVAWYNYLPTQLDNN